MPNDDVEPEVEDLDAHEPRVRLNLVTALLRILAGRRGFASVTWHAVGFEHRLTVIRTPVSSGVKLDADPEALGAMVAAAAERDALHDADPVTT